MTDEKKEIIFKWYFLSLAPTVSCSCLFAYIAKSFIIKEFDQVLKKRCSLIEKFQVSIPAYITFVKFSTIWETLKDDGW